MSRSRALTLSLALLLVVAGCTGPRAPAELGTATADEPAGTATPAPDLPVESRPSPWDGRTLTVAVETPGTDTNATPAVSEAAAFWSGAVERYAGYPAVLRVDPDAADPDIVVRVVGSIESCGGTTRPVGCAPVVREEVRTPVVVRVRAGLDTNSTVAVTKHELGHVLGLRHADAPVDVMRPQMAIATTPRTNATDRAFPWSNRTLDVYVDAGAADDAAGVDAEVDRALRYVESAEELPSVRFRRVASADDADVVVRVPDDADACSCFRLRGPDPDRDGAPEEYRRLTISLRDVPTEAVAWHVGDWLSYALGSERRADRPAPFREATPDVRRADDWETED